jgi:choline dehydrogenase-like flavoprotein
MNASDVIVVGSGASGVHAAYPLVTAGRSVTMLDVGYEDDVYEHLIPDAPFAEIRRTDPSQHRYFLGDRFEGVPLGPIGTKPELTPSRQYALARTEESLPTLSPDFAALHSLALGGLGAVWGAVCFPFSDTELIQCSLPVEEIKAHYDIIAKRIGVSGDNEDDLKPLRSDLPSMQPPSELDGNAEKILRRYEQCRVEFHKAGVYVGRAVMALLTQPLDDRRASPYHDMDYWTNKGESVYRPVSTLRELQKHSAFSYRRPYLVEHFVEAEDGLVHVHAASPDTGRREVFQARKLILAAGAMSTTRIVLRSLKQYNVRVPFTSNPTTYITSLNYAGLGEAPKDRCHSLAQVTMIYDLTGDRKHLVQGQLYSYRSMMLFRLLRGLPLPCRESLRMMRTLAPHFVVMVLQHEDTPSQESYCVLRETGVLEVRYQLSPSTIQRQRRAEKVIMKHLRRLRCWPVKVVHTRQGTGAHYASQLPISREDKPLTTEPTGRLRGTNSVYITDGAVLPYLPAKGLTFTLMANADRVGNHILKGL